MKPQSLKKSLARVRQLWSEQNYDSALEIVEELLASWPGNAQLNVLRGGLIQLQDSPRQTLEEAKQALQDAIDLDETSPAAAIELGHFLDAVEDDPRAAAKVYSKAVGQTRRLLIECLIGQAKALLQLGKNDEVLRCVAELVRLSESASVAKRSKPSAVPSVILRAADGQISMLAIDGPYAAQIESLVNDLLAANTGKAAS